MIDIELEVDDMDELNEHEYTEICEDVYDCCSEYGGVTKKHFLGCMHTVPKEFAEKWYDDFMDGYVEKGMSIDDAVREGFAPDHFLDTIDY